MSCTRLFVSILSGALLGTSCAPVASTSSLPDDPDARPAATALDVQVVERADALLSSADAWNRNDTRECHRADVRLSLYCALWRAQFDLSGSFDHRSAAMQEVRREVEGRTRGMVFEHRLMDWNNLPSTTLGDVHSVLRATAERLRSQLIQR